jgi:hypothetical protein
LSSWILKIAKFIYQIIVHADPVCNDLVFLICNFYTLYNIFTSAVEILANIWLIQNDKSYLLPIYKIFWLFDIMSLYVKPQCCFLFAGCMTLHYASTTQWLISQSATLKDRTSAPLNVIFYLSRCDKSDSHFSHWKPKCICGCVTVENCAFLNYVFKCDKVICCSNIFPKVFVKTVVLLFWIILCP